MKTRSRSKLGSVNKSLDNVKPKTRPKSKPNPRPSSRRKSCSKRDSVSSSATEALDSKKVGTYSLRRARKKVNYKEKNYASDPEEESPIPPSQGYAKQSAIKPGDRKIGIVPKIMTGKSIINLSGKVKKAEDDDDIVMSEGEISHTNPKMQELYDIQQKNQSESEEEQINTSRSIDSSQISKSKPDVEEEWKVGKEATDSPESDVSLYSDPEANKKKRGPKGPELKSVRELIEHSKYKKLLKASRESYKRLQEGEADSEKEGEGEGEGEQEKEDGHESDISQPVKVEEILPFIPPTIKCIRMPKHLKWVTIHHSSKVNETVLMQEIDALDQEIARLRDLRKIHQDFRESVGFPIGVMKSACPCCGQWTIKKHFCLHEICSAEQCKHKAVIMETKRSAIANGEEDPSQPRRGRPKRYIVKEDGIYDKESDSYLSQMSKWDPDNFIEDDIFIITQYTKEERKKHIEEFLEEEDRKNQQRQIIIDKAIEDKKKKQKEIEEKKKKREEKQRKKEEEKQKKPRKRRRKKIEVEDEKIIRRMIPDELKFSPNKNQSPQQNLDKNLVDLFHDYVPSNPGEGRPLMLPPMMPTYNMAPMKHPVLRFRPMMPFLPLNPPMSNQSSETFGSCSPTQFNMSHSNVTQKSQNPHENTYNSLEFGSPNATTDHSYSSAFLDIINHSNMKATRSPKKSSKNP
ncbi:unnamed protein product [Moneuplotes crassus]|uniref:Uncharacterized protein n=1 Tax=Euplotes crassus TaxID=5936 RepID=A0AAD1U186_EUPCR|nr:unnamed protein product [Moneuplotes crassus]